MKIPNLIGYQTSFEGTINYQTINPITDQLHPALFIEATNEEVDRSAILAKSAYRTYSRTAPLERAQFLRTIVTELELHKTDLLATYISESGLNQDRAEVEFARTTFQLQAFADLISSKNWEIKHHVDANPNRIPIPKPQITKYKLGIGPIVVFGASNFPFAYSTVGGDTAAALAAGCSVIVKSHPYHAHTSYKVAQLVVKVAKELGLPEGVFSHLNATNHEVGKQLVQHPSIQGVGFTGSIQGGLALNQLAQQREVPIPVFAEMGSLNPVVILPSALIPNSEDIATKLAISITKDAGQFCTKPGALFLVKSPTSDRFLEVFKTVFERQESNAMVHPTISHNYTKRAYHIIDQLEVQLFAKGIPTNTCNTGIPQLSITDGKTFNTNKLLQEEVFGPHALLVICKDKNELEQILENIPGQLTFSIFHNEENIQAQNLFYLAQEKAGRVILNGVPTGVEVSPAMQHGGPFPSSSDSRFTAVGTDSIERFSRGVAVQK
jgi:alpha-ketoglutaric semialdehyde dehydrogenase